MSALFEIKDNFDPSSFFVGNDFLLSDRTPSSFNVLRLITGSVQITNLYMQTAVDIEKNFLADNYEYNSGLSFEVNLSEILSEEIDTGDLKEFFFQRKYNLKNKDFFERLECEFCNFLIYDSKGSYTTAFTFLYRILELISFSFPLIYASKTYDFKGTYSKLKEIFEANAGSSKGELGFFKSAIKVMFSDSAFMETSVDILLDDERFENNERFYKVIKSVVTGSVVFHANTVENAKISISFGEVASFIIIIRNKFFHLFNRGDKNLDSIDIMDPDYFFSKMNRPLFSWICVVYVEIIRFVFEEYEKYVH